MTEDSSPETFLDQQVGDSLRPVGLGMAVLYFVLVAAHFLVLPPDSRSIMVICAGLSALVLLGAVGYWRQHPVPASRSHAAMTALVLIPLINSTVHIHLLDDPRQTTNLLILQVGLSLVLLRHRWFIASTTLLLVTWTILFLLGAPSPDWLHYGFALFSATLLSVVVHIAFHRQLTRLQKMHHHNRHQQSELEDLAQTAIANSRSKSRFIAHMSHELRTPLNAIIGFAKLLQRNRRNNLDEKQLHYLARVSNNGHHLLEIINQVLDLSSLEADRVTLTLTSVDLSELAQEILHSLHPLAREKELELYLEVPPNLRPIETDRNRLKQILINLLGNAIKFTQQGSVTLRLQGERQTLRPVSFVVSDTGPGIPADRMTKIFEPFEQLQNIEELEAETQHGSGLGLTICRLLCQRMGFNLDVSSTLGVGSQFSIELVDPSMANDLVHFDPQVTGTIAIVLKPNTDVDGIQVHSESPKEDS